jgi:LPXTG-motif cell wall-anchored protein
VAPAVVPAVTPAASPSPTASPSNSEFGQLGGDVNDFTDGTLPSDSLEGPSGDGGAGAPTPADVVKPGQGAVTVNGAAVASKLTRTGSRLILTSGGLSLELAMMVNGHEVMLPAGSYFTAMQGGHLYVWLKGFKAATPATVWGFSTPVLLTKLTIGADSKGEAGFTLPASMKPGTHMLVVSGTAANGKPATMTVGLVIKAAAAGSSSPVGHPAAGKSSGSGTTWLWWVLGGVLVLAGLIFFLIWRRRREDEEEETTAAVQPVKPALPSTSAMPQQRKSDDAKPALPKHHGAIRPRQPEADRDHDRSGG